MKTLLYQDPKTEHISRFKEGENYKKMTPKKKPPVKARKMFTASDGCFVNVERTPVFVLPATQEAYDAMVEQMTQKIALIDSAETCAKAVLAAIGITPPAK